MAPSSSENLARVMPDIAAEMQFTDAQKGCETL